MIDEKKSRKYSKKEVIQNFVLYVKNCVNYWQKENKAPKVKDKLEGLAFSILVGIDGEAGDLPKFILAPDPHTDDKSYCEKEGRNYYPDNNHSKVKCDISGELHHKLNSEK